MGNRLTPVVQNLLLLNLGIFALSIFIKEPSLNLLFGLRYVESALFAPWQLLTYMFLHASLGHIFSNMLGLYFFGPWLEHVFGSRRFLVFYMVAGIGAGILHEGVLYLEMQQQKNAIEAYVQNPNPDAFVRYMHDYEPLLYRQKADDINTYVEHFEAKESIEIIRANYEAKINHEYNVTVGASGAIFGILIAFAMIFPNVEMMLIFLPVPIRAKYFVLIYVFYELFAGLNYSGISNVAHFAHLGGALIGFLLVKFWGYQRQH
ncbi:MAG: rhomboid family intramembrane serine protease [Microscillaceae bacterium]